MEDMSIIGGVTSLPDKLSPGFGTLFDKVRKTFYALSPCASPDLTHPSVWITTAQYINVFGINIIAQESVPDIKVEHVANVLAQYLDNDEDGEVRGFKEQHSSAFPLI